MVDVVEIVLELKASGFAHIGRGTQGRVVRLLGDGLYEVEVDGSVTGVPLPSGQFSTVDQARDALVAYWDACDQSPRKSHGWIPVQND